MKKMYAVGLLFSGLFFSVAGRAAVVDISVVNFQFNPSNVNVSVGDIVRFNFTQGFHNAISTGDVIPLGAEPVNSGAAASGVRSYDYTVTLPGTYNYYCEVHGGPGGDGMAGKFTASGSLPVVLGDFNVQAAAGQSSTITWKTLTEQNVASFTVKSSIDGVHFDQLARIPAKGNSSSEQVYTYTDKSVSTTHRYVFYELVITDKDGAETLSPIKTFKTAFAATKLVMQMGPNPIKRPGQLMIQFNAEKPGLMAVNVYDAGGKLAIKTTMQAMPGLNSGHLHVCDLAAGTYTLQFNYEGIREVRKLVVR